MNSPQDLDPVAPWWVVRQVRDDVAAAFGIGVLDLIGRSRMTHLVKARNAACWVVRERFGLSYPSLGKLMGGRDHSTVIHAHHNAEALRERDPAFAALTDELLTREPGQAPEPVAPDVVARYLRAPASNGAAAGCVHQTVQAGRKVHDRNRFDSEDAGFADTDATKRFRGTQGLVAAIAASGGGFR